MKTIWYRLVNLDTGEKMSVSSFDGPRGVWKQLDDPTNWVIKMGDGCSQLRKYWRSLEDKEHIAYLQLDLKGTGYE